MRTAGDWDDSSRNLETQLDPTAIAINSVTRLAGLRISAGHARLARRWPHRLHEIASDICSTEYYRINGMKRIDLYIKVEVVLDEEEVPEKVAREICRQVEKIYVVRKAELSSAVARE